MSLKSRDAFTRTAEGKIAGQVSWDPDKFEGNYRKIENVIEKTPNAEQGLRAIFSSFHGPSDPSWALRDKHIENPNEILKSLREEGLVQSNGALTTEARAFISEVLRGGKSKSATSESNGLTPTTISKIAPMQS
ncbi:MAG: hypothetical protein CL565_06685 [Alphaproteobacteria bacterium]|mgnify:CR=1 FL=1|nr:hypothetical protein [Alphaproteobacteria bacterium]|tara:strand:- start:867 stop:1268 length:402 start_codon:yes stop_codon:yes gene_type:complete